MSAWPPQVPSADKQFLQCRLFVGGPRNEIVDAALGEGVPLSMGASTELLDPLYIFDTDVHVDSNVAFFDEGAFLIETANGLNVFTYKSKLDTDYLQTIKRISGIDEYFPVGTEIRQWYEITDIVESVTIEPVVGEVDYHYVCHVTGFNWNSSKITQENQVLVQARFWNSTTDLEGVGVPLTYTESATDDPLDAMPFSDWVDFYIGSWDEPEPEGNSELLKWRCTATGLSKWLKAVEISGDDYGVDIIDVTWTASTTLGDVGTEPTEGSLASSFDATNLGNRNVKDGWISQDVPVISTLATRPTGPLGPALASYSRLQQLAIANPDSQFLSRLRANVLEMYNFNILNDEEPDKGKEAYHAWILQNNYMDRMYSWSRNGYSTGELFYPPSSSLVYAYDLEAAAKIYNFGDGITTFEYQDLDGYRAGWSPEGLHRGLAKSFRLDPKSGWLAIRAGKPGRNNGIMFDVIDTVQQVVISDLVVSGFRQVTVTSTNGFAPFGHFGTDQYTYYYSSKDSTKFYGVTLVTGSDRDLTGINIFMKDWLEWWIDFVVWGNGVDSQGELIHIPDVFYQQGFNSDIIVDQNTATSFGNRVWQLGLPNVSPTIGIPMGGSIRRINAMGGGVGITGDYSLPGVFNADTHKADDWQVMQTPILGNMYSLGTSQWAKGEVSELETGTVLEDNSSDWEDEEESTITIADGAENTYEQYLVGKERIRTNRQRPSVSGGLQAYWDFTYTKYIKAERTFYGVTFVDGDNLTPVAHPGVAVLQEGDTLTKVVNTSPPGWPAIYEPVNLPQMMAMNIRRWKNSLTVTTIIDSLASNIFAYGPMGKDFPSSGTVSGAFVTFEYTGKNYNASTQVIEFTGVKRIANARLSIQPNETLNLVADISVPSEILIRISARPQPNDPLTYLPDNDDLSYKAQNPDWVDVYQCHGNRTTSLFITPQVQLERFYCKWIFVRIGEQKTIFSGVNERAKINEITVYRAPYSGVETPTTIIDMATRTFSSASIFTKMLDEINVPRYKFGNIIGGVNVRTIPIVAGGFYAAATELAQKTGCVWGESRVGLLNFHPDPRLPGALGVRSNSFVLDGSTSFGKARAKASPIHNVGQVIFVATNNIEGENYTITIPPAPIAGLASKRYEGFIVDNKQQAEAMARYILRKANRGWVYEVDHGQYYDLLPFDLIRVDSVVTEDNFPIIDVAQKEFQRTFIYKGGSITITHEGATQSARLEELISP